MSSRLSRIAAVTLIGLALMLGVPAAVSANSPDVLTIDTYSTGTTTATVEGILNPENQSTTYEAQYDMESSAWCQTRTGSPAYTTTGTDPVIVENAAQPISVNLTGLTEGADYCAELTATNGDGQTDGGPVYWTQGAPTVDTNDAFATGDSTAEVDGDVNPAGNNTGYQQSTTSPVPPGAQAAGPRVLPHTRRAQQIWAQPTEASSTMSRSS